MALRYTQDWIAMPHLQGFATALRREIESRALPEVCFTGPVAGEIATLDFQEDGCEGMAWSRLTTMVPALNFPEQDPGPQPILQMAWGLELGIVRPMEVPDNGQALSPEQNDYAVQLQLADMAAMLAVLCSYPDDHGLRILVGAYTPIGPDGGAVGGAWTATIGS